MPLTSQQRQQTEARIAELAEFRTQALSRLAAQHDELQHLRAGAAQLGNVRPLPSR